MTSFGNGHDLSNGVYSLPAAGHRMKKDPVYPVPSHIAVPFDCPPSPPSLANGKTGMYIKHRPGFLNNRVHVCWAVVAFCLFGLLLAVLLSWAVLSQGFTNLSGPLTGAFPHPRPSSDATDVHNVCSTKQCALVAANILHIMDEKVDPCEDFHKFVCGKFKEEYEIQPGQISVDIFSLIRERVTRQLRVILESEEDDGDVSTKMAKTYYESCMNDDAIANVSFAAFKESLEGLNLILPNEPFDPKLDFGSWESFTADLIKNYWSDSFFTVGVGPYLVDNNIKIYEVGSMSLPINHKHYVENDEKLSYYVEYLRATLIEIGGFNESSADILVEELMEFDHKIAKIHDIFEKKEEIEQRTRTTEDYLEDIFTVDELKLAAPQVDWDALLSVWNRNITGNETIGCDVEYVDNITAVIKETPLRIQRNSMIRYLLFEGYSFFPPEIKKIKEDYVRDSYGVEPIRKRWKYCTDLTTGKFPWIVGKTYVAQHFLAESKHEMQKMIKTIRNVLNQRIKDSDWMDEETKKRALEKSATIAEKIGYPERIYNETWLMRKFPEGIELSNDTFYENAVKIGRRRQDYYIEHAFDPIDKKDWLDSAPTVNAYYAPVTNEIAFPAGILQFPFYLPGAPSSFNYGRIGMVIGHELTHGYDSRGRQFNAEGNLEDWWNNETLTEFRERAQCFRDQFSAVLDVETGLYLNGNKSVTENIADTGGLSIAFDAFKTGSTKHQRLPGLTNFSPEQIFFISEASNWCNTYTPEYRPLVVTQNFHSAGRYRANMPLRNSPEFSKAFSCPIGSDMNPEDKCGLW